MASPTASWAAEIVSVEPVRRTDTSPSRKSNKSRMALRQRPNGQTFEHLSQQQERGDDVIASFRIGQPPIRSPTTPITLTVAMGSQTRITAVKATKSIPANGLSRSEGRSDCEPGV